VGRSRALAARALASAAVADAGRTRGARGQAAPAGRAILHARRPRAAVRGDVALRVGPGRRAAVPAMTAPPRVGAAIAVSGASSARALAAHAARVPALQTSAARNVATQRAPAKGAAHPAARSAFAVTPAAVGVGRAASPVVVARHALARDALIARAAARHRRAAPDARRHAAVTGVAACVAALGGARALGARLSVRKAADCLAEPVCARETIAAVGVRGALRSLRAAVAGASDAAQPRAALRVRRARIACRLADALAGLASARATVTVALARASELSACLARATLAHGAIATLVVVGAREPRAAAGSHAEVVLAGRARAARGRCGVEAAGAARLAASPLTRPVSRAIAGVGASDTRKRIATPASHAGRAGGEASRRPAHVREARAAAAFGVVHAVCPVGAAAEAARPADACPLRAAIVVVGARGPWVVARAVAARADVRAAVGVGRARPGVDHTAGCTERTSRAGLPAAGSDAAAAVKRHEECGRPESRAECRDRLGRAGVQTGLRKRGLTGRRYPSRRR
jgi:hypothetical protein